MLERGGIMDRSDNLEERIGRIVLAHTELDERLVQLLIELLAPLPESRVQLLVGSRSLVQKCDLIRSIAKDRGLSLHEELSSGETPHNLLKRVKNLSEARDSAIHSYYDRVELKRFRSRKAKTEPIPMEELHTLPRDLSLCSQNLHEFANRLAIRYSADVCAATRWGQITQGIHEIITAGHLHERELLEPLNDAVSNQRLIRVAILGVHRRFLEEGESPATEELLVEINPQNWLAKITTPTGETLQFGDTGWRDVTAMAQEEDATVDSAMIRRIGNQVLYSREGGDNTKSPWDQPQDRLAERAFGPTETRGIQVPSWLTGLEGFAPSAKQEDSAIDESNPSTE